MSPDSSDPSGRPQGNDECQRPTLGVRLKTLLFGAPRDLRDRSVFHKLSLVALLAWIGLGADGLSSSSYGPEEAYRTLGAHTYLGIGIGLMTALTVIIISSAYGRIIEAFPSGGGGYLVATKLLGPKIGVVSGSALLVDYVLTISVSVASSCDALFSFLPLEWQAWKFSVAVVLIILLTLVNIRGVKESVIMLSPIFVVFLVTHVVLILGGILSHAGELPAQAAQVSTGFRQGLATLGLGGMVLLFAHAYSMGGGTYTGIEAVSNGLPIMREPRVATAKHTMFLMAVSLSFTAGGLLVCYQLFGVSMVPGKTLNAALLDKFVANMPMGTAFAIMTLLSEGALLVVAAQAGFIDGPRVLANMAVDSWVPHRFAALSERLTTRNGILLMGAASVAALVYTHGDVRALVIMYSINVFLTFSLSMFGMLTSWIKRHGEEHWKRRVALFGVGFALCATILTISVSERFREGGWVTLVVTGTCIAVCFMVKRHYRTVFGKLGQLDAVLGDLPLDKSKAPALLVPSQPTAAVLVAAYSGLGIHTVLNAVRYFPGYFKNFVFVSVGVVDSGAFKGEAELDRLRARTEETLQQYVELAKGLGMAATYRYKVGTDVVDEAEVVCREVAAEFPRTIFLAGKVIFREDRWYTRWLHNQTALALQKRLQWSGMPMVILPVRVR